MATNQGNDINTLKTDVAVIKSDLGYLKATVNENHADIVAKMDKFAFVSQKDYNKRDKEFEERIKALEVMVYAGGVRASNSLFGNLSKGLLVAAGIGILIAIGIGIATLYPAIKGVT